MDHGHQWTRAMALALALLFGAPAAIAGPLEIAVVSSRDIAPYRAARQGFVAVLDEAGIAYRIEEFRTETDAAEGREVVQQIRSRRPDLILTIGSAATRDISAAIRDIPIVFSLVLQGAGPGEDELPALGQNVTGASMHIPLEVQFRSLREAIPTARRFGVMYNPDATGPVVDEAKQVAQRLGVDLVALPVRSEAEVLRAIESLEGKVDLLWSVADPTVFTPQSVNYILLNTLRHKIPFIGLSPSYVRAGALLALSCDYVDVGRQSGELALQIVRGAPPKQVAVTAPRSVSMFLNLNTAKQLEVAISEAVRGKAELISGS
jgi:putative ABC transport system substrate-binding protein